MNSKSILTAMLALAVGTASAYTVTFVGNECSTGSVSSAANWGTDPLSGEKSAWRNTSTAAKAFLMPSDGINAYGKDGYICPSTSNKSQVESGPFTGFLFSGSLDDGVFADTTRYIASIELMNINDRWGGSGSIDDPTSAISDSVDSVTPGDLRIDFTLDDNGDANPVTFMRITFNSNVPDHPVIRIGLACGRGDNQNPLAFIVGDVRGDVLGGNAYGWRHWTFFDIGDAAPGDTVDIAIVGNPGNGHHFTCANLVCFDSEAHFQNAEPVISAVAATPDAVSYSNWKAVSTLSVAASDADGDTLSYSWSQDGDQPGSFSMATPDAASCEVTVATAGTYKFRVAVSDGNALPVFTNVSFTVTMPAGEPHAEFVGFESTANTGAPWGVPYGGNKATFRSLSTGNSENDNRKNFLLQGHPNAYGLDGYVFLGNCQVDSEKIGPVVTGTMYPGNVISNVTDYIESFEAVYVSSFDTSCYSIDNPLESLSSEVSDFTPGEWMLNNLDGKFHAIARIAFNDEVANHPQVRIAILAGRGDNQKPSHIGVGGVHADWVGNNSYGYPDWAFFDVVDARPGDVVEIDLKNTRSSLVMLQGVIFDSVSTVANDPPVISSVAASPVSPMATDWKTPVALSATATDADGDGLFFSWTAEGAQPGKVTFSSANTASCTAYLTAAGTYHFQLDVTDAVNEPVSTNIDVTLTVPATAPHAEFVGFESTGNKNAAWGEPFGGNKGTYRSLNTGNAENEGLKNFLLPRHANAYGLDGYAFIGNCKTTDGNTVLGSLSSGMFHDSIVSNVTDYIDAFEVLYMSQGDTSCYFIDDPREEIGDDVSDIIPGDWWIRNIGTDYKAIAKITFGRLVRRHPQIRIAVLAGRGDSQKPTDIRVGGVAAQWVGANGYELPDWGFFDLMNAQPGDEVEIEIRNTVGGQTAIEGVIFDSVAHGAPGTVFLLR